jgi:hypothetical protein
MRCVVVRIPRAAVSGYRLSMVDSSLDLRFYALWCERLADESQDKNVADELRQISYELTERAQSQTLLKRTAA